MRSARAARLLAELSVLLVSLLPDAPMVLPLLLLDVSEEPLLAAGVLDELELVLGGVEALDEELEPLAPIEVPLLLGVDELEELVDGEELLESLLLALGVEVLLPLVPDAPLEPEAPIALVPGLVTPCEPIGLGAVAVLPLVPLLELPELCASAAPPRARAAAAATEVRVLVIALMLNSLIDMLGNAPAWRAG